MPDKSVKVEMQAAVKEKHHEYFQLSKFFVAVRLRSVGYHSLWARKIYWRSPAPAPRAGVNHVGSLKDGLL